MAHHLSWKLEQIFLDQGDLSRTLKNWFDSHEPLQKIFPSITRLYPDLKEFGGNSKWQNLFARRLYSVYHLVRGAAIRMHEAGGFDKFMTWRLLNCRPYGGLWRSAYSPDSGKAAGKQCRSLFCPWCYLRRYDALRKLLKAPVTSEVRFPAGNKATNPGVVPAKGCLSLTVFDAYGDPSVAELDRGVRPAGRGPEVVLAPVYDRVGQFDLQRRLHTALKHRLEGGPADHVTTTKTPEFHRAISTKSPFVRESDNQVGLRFAYFHNMPAPTGLKKFNLVGSRDTVSGVVEMERIPEIRIEEALLRVQPYPWKLLDKPPALQQELLAALKGRSSWGIHRFH